MSKSTAEIIQHPGNQKQEDIKRVRVILEDYKKEYAIAVAEILKSKSPDIVKAFLEIIREAVEALIPINGDKGSEELEIQPLLRVLSDDSGLWSEDKEELPNLENNPSPKKKWEAPSMNITPKSVLEGRSAGGNPKKAKKGNYRKATCSCGKTYKVRKGKTCGCD